jgi:RNA polymerase sigma-70 factor (ECF subfamily)
MTDPPITALLRRAREGDASARDALMPLLYRELHRLAEAAFRGEKPGNTLQPTVLVHEVFLKLFQGSGTPEFANRAHFLGIAARLMRQILVDHTRSRRAQKRGVQFTVSLNDRIALSSEPVDFIELNQALETLGREDAELVTLVEMRFIAGMTAEEVAEVRRESVSTVRRDVRYALARLQTLLASTAG